MTTPRIVSALRARAALGTRARAARAVISEGRYARWRRQPVATNVVLYEAFSGNGVLDNPEAIFRYLLAAPDMRHLEHVWVLDDLSAHPRAIAEFEGDDRVRFVQKGSEDYLRALATAKYLINNSTFPQEFAKRPEQVYLNTWHGVPLKHMGYDMPRGGATSRNIMRNFVNADYLLSSSPFMTDTMYREAYRLQGIFRGAVIEEGLPRTDHQQRAGADPTRVREAMAARGVDVAGRKVVLFAPTWRGESFHDPLVNAAQLVATVRDLRKALDPKTHVVLLKVHQSVYRAVEERLEGKGFLVPNDLPTNELLAVTDLLVTDYSSIVFDHLLSGRPVVRYVPDMDDYQQGRGLYLAPEELPGRVCRTVPELTEAVAAAWEEDERPYREAAQRFNPHDDGRVSERVVDLVFRGRDESGYRVRRDFETSKERLLIHIGVMRSMGITTSALNLLRNLDYDRYDVTVFYQWSNGRDRLKNIHLVDERARVLPRAPQFIGSRREVRKVERQLQETGMPATLDERHREFWTTEWQRMFGASRFDHLVDFSGYGCYAASLFSVVPARSKSMWLHNDMASDKTARTEGDKPFSHRLTAVFSCYKYFDNLVSVSPYLNELNREKLAEYADPAAFTYALNTIDGARVLHMAGLERAEEITDADGAFDDDGMAADAETTADQPVRTQAGGGTVPIETDNLAAAMNVLLAHYDVKAVIREARGRMRVVRASGAHDRSTVTFVSVGRLSAEKNHARLIRAFAKVHEDVPNTRLVIMGAGELQNQLKELVTSLGLEAYVVLAGLVDNPYAIMADSDCFVLSSDFEGQPMVILEARTLGLPVVATAFDSVADSVPEDAGIVVPRSVDGVVEGMQRFLKGEVPGERLDHRDYNRQAMEQFWAAITRRCADAGSAGTDDAAATVRSGQQPTA